MTVLALGIFAAAAGLYASCAWRQNNRREQAGNALFAAGVLILTLRGVT